MKSGHPPLLRLGRTLLLPLALLSERLGNHFYIGLAVAVIAFSLYGIGGGFSGGMKHQAYDLIMKSRFRAPPADADIVLVDIDEPALAAMAPEFGRWPWPRSVMAEITEGIANQGAAAIVFDIAFSDLDVDHPDADRYFRDVVVRYPNTYFAMIRLNAENDKLSELKLSQLPGAQALPGEASPDATVAMIVPHFFNVLNDRRLGTINLTADDDGIARRYHVHRDVNGYRIYSLPANVVAALGGELPDRSDVLLNWRGKPLSYRAVSFHEVYRSFLKEKSDRPVDEFKGKIVVVGSTAPSLFDISPTPVAQDHPGVEIMMTAIDNFKNGDYLTELHPAIYMAVTIVAIVLLTAAFVYNVDPVWLNTLFTAMQTGFLALTYLFVNFTVWFVDLTAPFTAALAYFFIVRMYNKVLTMRRNGHPLFSTTLDVGRECQVLLLACRLSGGDRAARRANAVLQQTAGLTRYGAAAPRLFSTAPLIYDVYRDTILFYWLTAPERTCEAMRDLAGMLEKGVSGLRARNLESHVQIALHAWSVTIDAAGEWRSKGKTAFAESLRLAQEPARAALSRSDAFAAVEALCPDVKMPVLVART